MSPTARPRIEGDREDEILEAAVELLLEVGYDRLTMDAVARTAHASKATLYRRWESKPALVIDALMRAKGMPDPQLHDTGSLRGDLMSTFCGHGGLVGSRASAVMGALITAVSTDPEFAELFRATFIAPKIAISQEIFGRAVERGEISGDLDIDIIGPALAGVVLHRMYVLGSPPDDAVVERVVDHLILPAVHYGTATAEKTATSKDPEAPKARKARTSS
ncbi:TetR/AcrR family transcriptional regulator [Nocardioides terrisoli]|uniref:TetR/AcrR family transcriptional regulator n=1 Tax=Nocardioides terrisoli TaxID=3388267 RepID=UPI00287BBAF2|nr:TetR/AcrR family transcriptional regulator [Nocardioides marmorisolisilvae]